MSFEESDTEESATSLSEVSSLDDDFVRMDLESENSEEEVSDDDTDTQVWSEIQSKSDAEFMEDYGLVQEVTSASADNTVLPIDCYRHFITDEIVDLFVRETNRYAEQYLQTHDVSRRSKSRQWIPTDGLEMLKFLGIIIQMGLVQMPKLEYYWSNSQLYGSEIIRSAMARDRFELFLKFWHFSDNHSYHSNQDRLIKLKPLLDLLKARFSSIYTPSAVVTIDETMIPWRGRLLFKQYIPGKAHKYGVKMYKLTTTTGYTWNFLIYTGEQDPMAGLGHAERVVMNLLDGLSGCYRTVVADNFFTSISLAERLLADDTYLIGTLRSNRTVSGKKILQRKLKRGEAYGLQNKEGVKLIMWKDKKDVLMISTRPSHSASVVDTGKINFRNESIMKPQVVVDYNQGRQGTDLSDQLSAYYTCLRRSIKWYRKVAFELIFGTAIVNSYLVYREHYSTNSMTILKFRESLVRSLLLGIPFEKLKPGPRQKTASQMKRKLSDHKLEEREGSARDVRRRCAGCYEKISQEQSREAGHATAKKVKTFCSDCDKFFCLDCFNQQHRTFQ
jgi:hypothetical protein